jgi:hypothetical protein
VSQDLAYNVNPCGARMVRALSMRGFAVMARLSGVRLQGWGSPMCGKIASEAPRNNIILILHVNFDSVLTRNFAPAPVARVGLGHQIPTASHPRGGKFSSLQGLENNRSRKIIGWPQARSSEERFVHFASPMTPGKPTAPTAAIAVPERTSWIAFSMSGWKWRSSSRWGTCARTRRRRASRGSLDASGA